MNVTDYQSMAREHLICNATVAALHFGQLILKHMFSVVPLNKSSNALFCTTSTHLLCQQSEESFIWLFRDHTQYSL